MPSLIVLALVAVDDSLVLWVLVYGFVFIEPRCSPVWLTCQYPCHLHSLVPSGHLNISDVSTPGPDSNKIPCSRTKVASRVVCKMRERVTGPVLIHTVKNTVKDAFTTAAGGEGAHGADASADFHKESLDDVGGSQSFPMRLRTVKEG